MTDQEQIKYHAAREIWHKQHELVPSGRCTWARWFKNMYGENYLEYTSRMRKKKAA